MNLFDSKIAPLDRQTDRRTDRQQTTCDRNTAHRAVIKKLKTKIKKIR